MLPLHSKNRTICCNTVANRIEQYDLLPTLLMSTIMLSIVAPDSGSTVLFHLVDNYEQCGSKTLFNLVNYTAGSEFLTV
jgi:hypothetical protein